MKTLSLVYQIRITDNSSSFVVERNREGKREREEGKKGYSKETISAQILAFLKWQAKQPPRSFERVLKSAFNSVYSQLENRCLHRQFRGGSVCSIIETRGHEISRFYNLCRARRTRCWERIENFPFSFPSPLFVSLFRPAIFESVMNRLFISLLIHLAILNILYIAF